MSAPVVDRSGAHALVELLADQQAVLDAAFDIASERAGEAAAAKARLDDAMTAVQAAQAIVTETRRALNRAIGAQWAVGA